MRAVIIAAVFALAGPSAAQAEAIERACMNSGREAASHCLCSCIQNLADMMLSRRDQVIAASFLRSPDLSQEVRQSNRRSDERFWKKYTSFGHSAEMNCG